MYNPHILHAYNTTLWQMGKLIAVMNKTKQGGNFMASIILRDGFVVLQHPTGMVEISISKPQ